MFGVPPRIIAIPAFLVDLPLLPSVTLSTERALPREVVSGPGVDFEFGSFLRGEEERVYLL